MTKTIRLPLGACSLVHLDLDDVVEALREVGYTVVPMERVKTVWLEHLVERLQLELAKVNVREEVQLDMIRQLARAIVEVLPIVESDGPTWTSRRFRAELSVILPDTAVEAEG